MKSLLKKVNILEIKLFATLETVLGFDPEYTKEDGLTRNGDCLTQVKQQFFFLLTGLIFGPEAKKINVVFIYFSLVACLYIGRGPL